MNPDESGHSGRLADSDLDQLLAVANQDLLAHIAAAADPTAALTSIISGSALAVPAGGSATPASGRDADRTPAALAIGIRADTRRLGRVLDRSLDRTHVLERDLQPASSLSRGLGPQIARALASDLAGAIASDLGTAHKLASALVRALMDGFSDALHALNTARTSALRLAEGLAHDPGLDTATALSRVAAIKDILTMERDRARDLDRVLGAQQVDASGADLSEITIEDLDTLDGVIWTGRTTWPPGIAEQVRACSHQIRPGVYQIHGGNERDPAKLAVV